MSSPHQMQRLHSGKVVVAIVGLRAASACSGADGSARDSVVNIPSAERHLFTKLRAAYTGVRFVNRITRTNVINVFTYRNFNNGDGVAAPALTVEGLAH